MRMQSTRWSRFGIALLWLTAPACGEEPCEEDAVRECSCGEQEGEQTCTSDGRWDECACYDESTPPDVEGRLFRITSDSVRWAEPPGFGSLMGGYMPPVLLQVGTVNGSELEMIGTTGTSTEPPEQNLCVATTTFESATLEGTWFDTGVVDFEAQISGVLAVFYDFRIQADFSPTGLRFEDGTFETTLDIREVGELLQNSVEETCALAETLLETACQPCPSDGSSYCLTVVGKDVAGTVIDSAELSELTADQAAQCEL